MRSTLRRLAPPVAAIAVLALMGCGSDDDTSTAAATSGSDTSTTAAAFPATVEHKFGTTTVPEDPERIVVVGLTEQDTVLALGRTPVATTEWYGDQPDAVWPWAQDELGNAEPEVLSTADGFQYEKIAGLRPDLILGTNAGIKEGDYEKLSAIAPTVASPKGSTDYFSAWDEQVRLIAQSLGQKEQGEELVAETKAKFEQAAEEHPEFAGKTATFAQNAFYNGLIYVYPEGLNTEFLTYLGFEMNPEIDKLAKTPGEQVGISEEQLPLLDADVVVFATEKPGDIPELEKVPTFKTLDAVADHRAVFTDGTLAGAMYFMTPLSLDYVAEHLPDQLAAALEGEAPREIVDTAAK